MTTPPAAVAPLPTIGEVLRTPRSLLWILGVYLPSAIFAVPAALAYCLYYTSAFVRTDGGAWRLLPLLLWGVYMALVAAEWAYMELFLPRAPMAARDALADVGWIWVGVPLNGMATAPAFLPFVRTWMLISIVCLLVVFIAAVVALWVWLIRTYSTGQYTEVGNGGSESDWFLALFLICIKPYVEEEPKPAVSSTVLD